jgi:hypothetical protein
MIQSLPSASPQYVSNHLTTDSTEAFDLLASVHDWFTEGFDTLDLKEAKALLEELESRVAL